MMATAGSIDEALINIVPGKEKKRSSIKVKPMTPEEKAREVLETVRTRNKGRCAICGGPGSRVCF